MAELLAKILTVSDGVVAGTRDDKSGEALASALGAFMDGDGGVPERTGNRHPALAIAPYSGTSRSPSPPPPGPLSTSPPPTAWPPAFSLPTRLTATK